MVPLAITTLFLALVVFGNLTDYGSNYAFVEGVLSMETTFEGNAIRWRAIHAEWVYHVFYATIILWEAAAMALCGWGTWVLWKARRSDAATWQRAKRIGALGYTLSMAQWYLAFITVGGEWFAMWQSPIWNGQEAATRMFLIMGVSLLFLLQADPETEPSAAA